MRHETMPRYSLLDIVQEVGEPTERVSHEFVINGWTLWADGALYDENGYCRGVLFKEQGISIYENSPVWALAVALALETDPDWIGRMACGR